MLRQIDFCHLARVFCPQGFKVEVYLLLMAMIRHEWIMTIDMHMQPHALDKHQGDGQVEYPEGLSYQ